ncbi:hypothetical protein CspeluHIS016_0306030 [Cutaneotrichosporon spelunceum]|uniref:Fe2OG dioxygenase domain-containing protein n=1 Tax=Cutaneotrichosporon spelunceum TaxID=1672016 RepID=A0AAD3TUA4_9TREE|nr:hypothetical protein CspeluHIS016_0306030 [Cutaneotrichosporon spelunceum]
MALAEISAQLLDDFTDIPVVDMTDAAHPDAGRRIAVAHEIRAACLNQGFFYVKNHGVPKPIADAAFTQSKRFFNLDEGVKRSVDISKSDNFRGYTGVLAENNDPDNKGDYHEAFNIGLDPLLAPAASEWPPSEVGASEADTTTASSNTLRHGENLWPETSVWTGADEFKSTTLQYYASVLALGKRLFPLIALALDLPETFFDDKTQHPAAIMRLLFYPGRRDADERMPGIGAHTDFECFTILRQDDVPALQVSNREGKWLDAQCIPDTFVVNIGDQLARWTNDVFVSTRHRVLPTRRDRYSIPFFFGCDHGVVMDPIPTCVSSDRPNRYEVMTAGDYVHMRLSDIYAGVKD